MSIFDKICVKKVKLVSKCVKCLTVMKCPCTCHFAKYIDSNLTSPFFLLIALQSNKLKIEKLLLITASKKKWKKCSDFFTLLGYLKKYHSSSFKALGSLPNNFVLFLHICMICHCVKTL